MILGLAVVFLANSWGSHPSDPVGDASDTDWNNSGCRSQDRFARLNGAGEVATFRESACQTFGGALSNPDVRYFVFVKQLGEDSNRQNLVLRIEDAIDTPPPVITWLSPSRLRISYVGPLSNVYKRVTKLGGTSIELSALQPYAGLSFDHRGMLFYPEGYPMVMTFDLLALPNAAPSQPLAPTGDFSEECGDDARSISEPLRLELSQLATRLEIAKRMTGAYPRHVDPIRVRGLLRSRDGTKLVPSGSAPVVTIIYHRTLRDYALDLEFPDLIPGYRNDWPFTPLVPAQAFLSCTAVHYVH